MEYPKELALVIAGNFCGDEANADLAVLLRYLPEDLALRCDFIEWSTQPSLHYSMKLMLEMTDLLESLVIKGYRGIIVVSGSAVMEEMAYFTDLLWRHYAPVIFANLIVQGRSGVHEGLMNLDCSVRAALSEEAEGMGVIICSSGEFFAASEAVMVDPVTPDNTFQSRWKDSLGKVLNGEVKFFRKPHRPEFLAIKPTRTAVVEAVWTCLGGGERILSALASDKELEGLVIAGSGTGSIPPSWVPHVRNIMRRRVPVALVSRCYMGQVREGDCFEGSFAKLTEMGVISGGKLTPYQARIKMSLGIGAGLTEHGLALYMRGSPVDEHHSGLTYRVLKYRQKF